MLDCVKNQGLLSYINKMWGQFMSAWKDTIKNIPKNIINFFKRKRDNTAPPSMDADIGVATDPIDDSKLTDAKIREMFYTIERELQIKFTKIEVILEKINTKNTALMTAFFACVAVFVLIAGTLINFSGQLGELRGLAASVAQIEEDIKTLNAQDETASCDSENLDVNEHHYINESEDVQQDSAVIVFTRLFPSTEFEKLQQYTFSSFANFTTNAPIYNTLSSIGINSEGEYLFIDDIAYHHFYISFPVDDGGEIWFYGTFDEQGRWHGFGVLNHFRDGVLIAIYEAHFVHGQSIGNYRQLTVGNANQSFRLQDRYRHNGFTDGETFVYRNAIIPEDNFKTDTPVRINDIIKYGLISYYRGRISNNRFNDNTGNAVLISYTEDGVIRTLYRGHIVDGIFVDQRPFDESGLNGHAFWISLTRIQSQYVFEAGPFLGGHPINPEERRIRIGTDENPSYWLPPDLDICTDLLRWKSWDDE